MNTQIKVFPHQSLMVLTADGQLDIAASKATLKAVAESSSHSEHAEVLLDLRETNCSLSISDIYELATYMASPKTGLPTHEKIAVLVDGAIEFDHAKFLALCAVNRGISIRAFDEYDAADDWLKTTLPPDTANDANNDAKTI